MRMNFFEHISHFIAVIGLVATSFLSQHHVTATIQSPTPSVAVQNSIANTVYTADKTITYNGYTVTISLTVPQSGGNVTGSVSGDCSGTITGLYDGNNNGKLTAYSNSSCSLLFVHIPGTAAFTGIFNKESKSATGQATIKVGSFQKTEPVTVNFS